MYISRCEHGIIKRMDKINLYEGACGCGEITFEVKAQKPSWCGHCHCNQCQKIHGAPYVTWVGFHADSYAIKDPKEYFKVYKSSVADRGFCSNCGSNFYFRYHDKKHKFYRKDAVLFARPNIDTDLKIEPLEHIYYASKKDWYPVDDDLSKRLD